MRSAPFEVGSRGATSRRDGMRCRTLCRFPPEHAAIVSHYADLQSLDHARAESAGGGGSAPRGEASTDLGGDSPSPLHALIAALGLVRLTASQRGNALVRERPTCTKRRFARFLVIESSQQLLVRKQPALQAFAHGLSDEMRLDEGARTVIDRPPPTEEREESRRNRGVGVEDAGLAERRVGAAACTACRSLVFTSTWPRNPGGPLRSARPNPSYPSRQRERSASVREKVVLSHHPAKATGFYVR